LIIFSAFLDVFLKLPSFNFIFIHFYYLFITGNLLFIGALSFCYFWNYLDLMNLVNFI